MSLQTQNFYIILFGALSELIILGLIFYSYFREIEIEKQLSFWFVVFSLIAIGELSFLLSHLEIRGIGILEQFSQILSALVFLSATIDFKLGKIWTFLPIAFSILIIGLLNELAFTERLRYIVPFVLVAPILVFSGVRVILRNRFLGLALIMWGILTLFRFVPETFIYLIFRGVATTILGLAILISILDKYRLKEVRVERLYHTIVDVMNEALVLLDPDGKITYINNRFCGLMRYKNPRDLIGRKFLDFILKSFMKSLEKNK